MSTMRYYHQAPPVDDEAVSPFRTPCTRLVWSSLDAWLIHARALERRRVSAATYLAQAAHLDELARHPDFLAAQPADELAELIAFITRKDYAPSRGHRAGTSWERVVVEAKNALDRARRHELFERSES